jgi:hypothetical protein
MLLPRVVTRHCRVGTLQDRLQPDRQLPRVVTTEPSCSRRRQRGDFIHPTGDDPRLSTRQRSTEDTGRPLPFMVTPPDDVTGVGRERV